MIKIPRPRPSIPSSQNASSCCHECNFAEIDRFRYAIQLCMLIFDRLRRVALQHPGNLRPAPATPSHFGNDEIVMAVIDRFAQSVRRLRRIFRNWQIDSRLFSAKNHKTSEALAWLHFDAIDCMALSQSYAPPFGS